MSTLQKLSPPTPIEPLPVGLACLLCGNPKLQVVWQLDGISIRKILRLNNHNFSETAFDRLRAETMVHHYECCACGFRFFDPALAGGALFYEQLQQNDYYVTHRPEFDFALKLGQRINAQKVLDIGGGEGAFLDLAKKAGLETYGLELNAKAADSSAKKGHLIFRKSLAEISPAEFGTGVDMLTLFQVIEHVPDPCNFLDAAATLVRPGGLLVVSVPNACGVHRFLPWDPLDLPPHHISRWRRKDLKKLGDVCGLQWLACGADVLYGSDLESFLLYHNQLARAMGQPERMGGEYLPKIASFLYRKLGCRHYGPRAGLSIYAAYQKPNPQ